MCFILILNYSLIYLTSKLITLTHDHKRMIHGVNYAKNNIKILLNLTPGWE